VKVTIDGQVYEYDGAKAPMHEALWIEHVYKRNYGQWQIDLAEGSARAFVMLACLIWRREGKNVETAFQDVIDGTIDFDLNEMSRSLGESAEAEQKAQAGVDPTIPGASSDPAGSPGTGIVTSSSSPASSTSGRGRSGSSTSRTSKRS
jgi:hypothetical protein